jgi:hypothetical protein
MELVIRYLGPLAVGVNGADPAFLSYKKGIFDSPHCDQRPNHALLIVGYGQDILDNGTKVSTLTITQRLVFATQTAKLNGVLEWME